MPYRRAVAHDVMTAEALLKELRELEAQLEEYPDERGEILLELAAVHLELDEPDRAIDIWRDLIVAGGEDGDCARVDLAEHLFDVGRDSEASDELSALKAGRRTDSGAWMIAAELLAERGDLAGALTWYTMATERFSPADLAVLDGEAGWDSEPGWMVRGRRSVRVAMGLPPDETDLSVPDEDEIRRLFRDEITTTAESVAAVRRHRDTPVEVRILFWPRAEFRAAVERWPEIGEKVTEPEYYAALEANFGALSAEGAQRISAVLCSVDSFAAHLDSIDGGLEDTADRDDYLDGRYREGHFVEWPPQRNQPCWCGSAIKYKKCCGAPRR